MENKVSFQILVLEEESKPMCSSRTTTANFLVVHLHIRIKLNCFRATKKPGSLDRLLFWKRSFLDFYTPATSTVHLSFWSSLVFPTEQASSQNEPIRADRLLSSSSFSSFHYSALKSQNLSVRTTFSSNTRHIRLQISESIMRKQNVRRRSVYYNFPSGPRSLIRLFWSPDLWQFCCEQRRMGEKPFKAIHKVRELTTAPTEREMLALTFSESCEQSTFASWGEPRKWVWDVIGRI